MRALFLLGLLVAGCALASEQPLSFTLTGPALDAGTREAFVSTTPRFGRPEEFIRFDNRVGLNYGLGHRLESQLLIAFFNTQEAVQGVSTGFGVQTRLRWQPLDSRTDPVGLNLVATLGAANDSLFFEGRLGAEARLGNFLFALNLSVDDSVQRADVPGPQLHTEQTGGIAYRLPNNFTTGFEVRNRVGFDRGTYFGDAVFAGLVFGWKGKNGWFSLAALPQVAAIKAHSQVGNGEALELRDNERVVLRLQLGFDF